VSIAFETARVPTVRPRFVVNAHSPAALMDPFVDQLASLCRQHVTRAKWVFVPSHATLTPNAYERQLETYRSALGAVGCEIADAALVHVRSEK
jgi:chemotaxis response regulator CheB